MIRKRRKSGRLPWQHIIGIILALGAPVIVNWLVGYSLPDWMYVSDVIGQNTDWLGFYGNYAGALVGIIYAVLVAISQARETRRDLQNQIQNNIEREAVEKRMFVDFQWINSDIDLTHNKDKDDSRIIITKPYAYWMNKFDSSKINLVSFGRFKFIGNSPLVFDVFFRIIYRDDFDELQKLEYHIGEVLKENIYLIPIISTKDPVGSTNETVKHAQLNVNLVEVEFKTLGDEHLIYISDIQTKMVSFIRLDKNNDRLRAYDIMKYPMQDVSWIYPGTKQTT